MAFRAQSVAYDDHSAQPSQAGTEDVAQGLAEHVAEAHAAAVDWDNVLGQVEADLEALLAPAASLPPLPE